MKKISLIVATALCMMLGSCGMGTPGATTQSSNSAAAGGGMLGSVISAVTNGQVVGNVLQSVLGLDKLTKADLVGSWNYSQPGCAFTSKELLAQAGGEAVAQSIKDKMAGTFQTVGISSANTKITFNQDGTFSSTIAGKSFSGKYSFDESTYKVTLQGLLLNINCYAKKNSNGVALLFEASKLLTILQTMATLSGNSTAQTIGDLSKNYDGLRLGFDFKK
jgi:hypothetical protein